MTCTYNRYGYLRYSERRERSNGKFEMRKSNLPARLLFGTYNFPKTRPGLTYAMMKVAKKIHDHNHNSEGWKPIRKDLQKRFDPMEVVR